jgi:hypothetical protein
MNGCLVSVTTTWLCKNKVIVFRWIDNDNDIEVEQGIGRSARGLASDVLISGRPDRPHGRLRLPSCRGPRSTSRCPPARFFPFHRP